MDWHVNGMSSYSWYIGISEGFFASYPGCSHENEQDSESECDAKHHRLQTMQ